MRGIKRHRKTLVRYGLVTGNSKGKEWASQQMSIQGAVQDVQVHFPYGIHANCTPGTTLAVVMNLNETTDNIVGFPWNPNTRPTLEVGEVALYSPDNGQIITLKADGSIDIVSSGDVNITATNVNMTGNLTVTGTINGNQIITDAGIDLDVHTHLGSPTAPVGAISNTGTPL